NELASLPIGGGKIDVRGGGAGARVQIGEIAHQFMGFVDARFGFGGASLGAAAQPFELVVDAIFEGVLMLLLSVKVTFLGFEEFAVVSRDAQITVFIGPAEFNHGVGDIFQEIAVMADDHTGELRVSQNGFQPLDSFEVKMVGGLVEQENVRLLHQSGGDGQTFAPAARERVGDGVVIFESGAAEDL